MIGTNKIRQQGREFVAALCRPRRGDRRRVSVAVLAKKFAAVIPQSRDRYRRKADLIQIISPKH
jgi:hypothetical protein